MPYVGPDGRITERRSPWRWSIISDFFQGVYDFLALFLVAIINPPQLQGGVSHNHINCTVYYRVMHSSAPNYQKLFFSWLLRCLGHFISPSSFVRCSLFECIMISLLFRLVKQITGSVNKDVHRVVLAEAVVATFEVSKIYKGRLVHVPEVGEAPNAIEEENLHFLSLVHGRARQRRDKHVHAVHTLRITLLL